MSLDAPECRAATGALLEQRYRRARGLTGFFAGARRPPDLERIASRGKQLGTPEAAQALREQLAAVPKAEQPALQRLFAALVEELAEQAGATAHQRELELLASATVSVELERTALAAALREVRTCFDRMRRAALARGIESALEPVDAAQAERLEEALAARAKLDLAPGSLVGTDGARLSTEAEQVLRDSRDAAMDLFAFRLRRAGVQQAGAEHDLSFAMELLDLREHLAPRLARPLAEELVRALELEPLAAGQIALDFDDRPERFPGVFVERFSSNEIAIAASLLGTPADAERACVAFGRAQHLAQTEEPFPDRARILATGLILARPLAEPAWYRRVLRLPSRPARELAQAFAVRALLALREAAARFLCARDLEARGPSARLADRFRSQMIDATGAEGWRRGAFALQLHHAADALRAFAIAEQLARELVEGFNEDWWRNPHASELLGAFWAAEDSRVDARLIARGYIERAA